MVKADHIALVITDNDGVLTDGTVYVSERGEEMKQGIMLDRLGTPADIAQLVAFLATSEPCFITGQHFVVDGFQWSC